MKSTLAIAGPVSLQEGVDRGPGPPPIAAPSLTTRPERFHTTWSAWNGWRVKNDFQKRAWSMIAIARPNTSSPRLATRMIGRPWRTDSRHIARDSDRDRTPAKVTARRVSRREVDGT